MACRVVSWHPATWSLRGEVGEVSALYLLARMTMSIPQNILIIQPTITIAVRIWIRAAAMFSQKTQHMCLSGRSVRAPHSTVKADTKVPRERAATKHPVKATASCQIPSLRPTSHSIPLLVLPLQCWKAGNTLRDKWRYSHISLEHTTVSHWIIPIYILENQDRRNTLWVLAPFSPPNSNHLCTVGSLQGSAACLWKYQSTFFLPGGSLWGRTFTT